MLDKIAIDLDGTISNSVDSYNRILNEKFGYNFKYEDVTKWHYTDLGVKEEHVKELFSMAETFENTKPYVFAPAAIQYLEFNLHVQVHIVTDRPNEFYDLTSDWLYDNMIPYTKLVLLPAKDKIKYLADNKIDVVVDDRPDMPPLYNYVCEFVFLPMRPYNSDSKGRYTPIWNFEHLLQRLITYNLLPQECRNDL